MTILSPAPAPEALDPRRVPLTADPALTPAVRVRAVLGATSTLLAAGAALAFSARSSAGDPVLSLGVSAAALLGVALALVQGPTASDRRGRRRFALVGLGLASIAAASTLLPGLAPGGAVFGGIGTVLAAMAAAGWLGDVVPSRVGIATLTVAATAAGVATGAVASPPVILITVAVAVLGVTAGAETIAARRTPVFVLPAAPRLAGKLPGVLATCLLAGAQLVILLGPVAGGIATAVFVGLLLVVGRAPRRAASTAPAAPGTKDYSAAVTPFDASATLEPAAAAVVTDVDDVRAAVAQARSAGLGVSMHSTGHAAMGHPDLGGQLLLRVRMAGDVEVDSARGLVRIPAGAAWSDVVGVAARHALAVPHGSSGHVGVVGYLTRGGLSAYGRHTGVAANSLESLELVTADGEHRTVDRENDPDLFWALRGGGGGFGVVTAATVRAFHPGEVVTGTTAWELDDARGVGDAWARWTATAPAAITTSLRILEIPPLPGMPLALTRRPLVVIDGAAVEGDVDARSAVGGLLRELRAVARPVLDTWRSAGSGEVPNTHMDPPFSPAHSSAHALLGDADWRDEDQAREVVAAFLDAATRPDSGVGIAELRQLGGALADAPADGGAVAHYRGAFGWLAIALHGKGGADTAAAGIDRMHAAVGPWATGYTAPTLAVERARPARSFPAETAHRVASVRHRIDPDGLFRADVAVGALAG